jgi:Alternative complex III, ActD subunit
VAAPEGGKGMSAPPGGVLAAFRHVDDAAHAVRELKAKGYAGFTVYTPVPNQELASAIGQQKSPVRLWTLLGGLTGLSLGFLMTMWMSVDYPIVVGGKPIPSVIPYIVIMFELTILCGALATITGLIVHAVRGRRPAVFDPRFTDDHIGVFVPCAPEGRGAVQQLLQDAGAEEVRLEA